MKTIRDQNGIGQLGLGRLAKGCPLIGCYRFHFGLLLVVQNIKRRLGLHLVPSLGHLQNAGTFQIRKDSGIAVAGQQAFLVNANMANSFSLPAKQPSFNTTPLNGLDPIPGKPQKTTHFRQILAGHNELDGEGFKIQGVSAMGLRPRRMDLMHIVFRTVRPGNRAFNEGGKGHLGQMTPSLSATGFDRPKRPAFRTIGQGSHRISY